MYVYALFDNESSELITIHFLNTATNKLLELYMQSFHSPKVRDSAKIGIECAYEIIFSGEIEKYIQKSPISVTPKDFKQQVDGSSAGLAYAVAFAIALKYRNIIDTTLEIPEKIAATGELDNHANVTKVKHLKQKILAAIKENVNLLLYPSENYEELLMLQKSDIEFSNALKDSGISLKHVSNLKQAFCELGILPSPTLTINPVKTNDKDLVFDISLSNDSKIEFKSFELTLMYDASKLKLENIFDGSAINGSKYLELISPDKNNKKFVLTLNLKKDFLYAKKIDSPLIRINCNAIDNLKKYSSNLLEFCENECSINGIPYSGAGGFIFNIAEISFLNKKNSQKEINIAKAESTNLNSDKPSTYSTIKAFFTGKLKLITVVAGVFVILIGYKYFMGSLSSPANQNNPTPTSISIPTLSTTPLITAIPTLSTTPPITTIPSSTLSPSQTDNVLSASASNKPQPSNTPELFNSTPLTTPVKTPKKAITQIPAISVKPITPAPKTVPLEIKEAMNPIRWESKSDNITSTYDEDRQALNFEYTIKGNGHVNIATKPILFSNIPDGYSTLNFSCRCYPITDSKANLILKIYYNNKPKSYFIGGIENIANEHSWIKTQKYLEKGKITGIEFYIETVGADDNAIDSGSLLIRDLFVSP